MPDEPLPASEADLVRTVKQHLQALQSAGVEALPTSKEPAPSGFPDTLFAPSATPTPPPVDPLTRRRQELEVLAGRVSTCTRCPTLVSTRSRTVFGVGTLDPELCLIGEAPGADEDAVGEPFVGAAGQMLNRILTACGLKREDVYICNIIKCRPPGNRQPAADEAGNCREYLERQLELVNPRHLCTLGGTAAQNLLGTRASLGKLRGKVHDYHGIPVVCTYHPAYLLPHRNPDPSTVMEKKKLVWEDMKLLLTRMGRPVEAK